MRGLLLLAIVGMTLAFGPAVRGNRPALALTVEHGVVVTNPGDVAGGSGAVCPDPAFCTLRHAIEVANLDAEPGTFEIRFDPDVFPSDAPVAITVGSSPLPTISREDVSIDGLGAGVAIVGTSGALSAAQNGITATAAKFSLRNLQIRSFSASCVAATGEGAQIGGIGAGNVLGGCANGVAVAGTNSTIAGNLVGFTPAGGADPVQTGVIVSAGSAKVGGPVSPAGAGNVIGFSDVGVFVGAGAGPAFTGVVIEGNTIGKRPNGEAAAVGVGVMLSQPSGLTAVRSNSIANSQTGIQVRPDQATSVVRNSFKFNTFEAIDGLAIDLGADGVRDANDEGDLDAGPNNLLNHPLITRATQLSVTGTACAGCEVQLYLADHEPGGATDFGTVPIPLGLATADGTGSFQVSNPAASASDWLVALATDPDGNTSEFGPPARIGSGAVLCGNVQLQAGWNHVGYFGSDTVALLDTFPVDPEGSITAIFRTIDGTDEWQRWYRGTAAERTLNTVQPGESYWFYATSPVTLAGGFSVSFPVPVELKAGNNDLTYLGATAHVLDALSSLGGAFKGLYRYNAATGSWDRFGDPGVPAWAQDFTTLEACGTYQVELDAPATLIPLQP
ncbi:MAG: hypothetical protein AB7J35_00820 [Dehalococcoidia bacterium]